MEILVSNRIRIKDPPDVLKDVLIDELRLPNPKFEDAQRNGYSTYGIPPLIHNFSILPDDSLQIPRGYIKRLLALLSNLGINGAIIHDNRFSTPPNFDIDSSHIKLRPYQLTAITSLVSTGDEGLLVAPAGSGKTVMGISLIPMLGQKMLWLTHTKPLLEQVLDRLKMFLPGLEEDDVGMIGAGKWDIGNVFTAAMVQTLVRRPIETHALKGQFGIVVLDECLVAGSKINMLDGTTKDVENVKNGDLTTFGEVSNKFCRETNKVTTVRTSAGTIKGTPAHLLPYIPKNTLFEEKNVIFDKLEGINKRDFLLADIILPTEKYKKMVNFRGIQYRCVPVIEKYTTDIITKVYDFTTKEHLFVANGILSSNCHHCPATTFTQIISSLDPHYLYGLTATHLRRDGLHNLMYQTIGNILHEVPLAEVKKYGGIIVPQIWCRNIKTNVAETDFHKIIQELVENDDRNNLIVSDVVNEAAAGNICVVITERRAHGDILHSKIAARWDKVGIVTGNYTDKHNKAELEKLRKGEITVLIATSALLGEGFDHAPINRGFLCLPFRNMVKTEQVVGRIQRTSEGKKDAIIYDYIDNHSLLQHQFRNNGVHGCRFNIYKKLGCTIQEL